MTYLSHRIGTAAAITAVAVLVVGCATSPTLDPQSGMPLVTAMDFEDGTLDGLRFTDPAAWELADGTLALTGESNYEPPVRSPGNIAWVDGVILGDFVLEADVQYTGRDYGHADLCFFLGHVGPAEFYYAHVAHEADPHANSIFIVDRADRTSIATERTDGQRWGTETRRVRIERDTTTGRIEVLLDGESVMIASDRTFVKGEVGFGSFDDTGRFDNITIYGKKLN